MSSRDESQTLWEHLKELKNYVLFAVAALIVGASITQVYHVEIIKLIFAPLGTQMLVFLSPLDPLLFVFKVDFYGGLFLSLPVIMFCVFRFITPAIAKQTSTLLAWFCGLSILLVVAASAYTYLLLLPLSINFLLSIQVPGVQNLFTADQYLGFAFMELALMAGIFQIPSVVLLLVFARLLNPHILSKNRGVVWVTTTVVLAIITPTTDLYSLSLFLVPTLVIFELSILLGKAIYLLRNRKTARYE
jgi:sec-independent protein translocase protein TatC